ncbi:MAG: hypothetical protein LH471_04905, partial [Salinibacterium sp.]|nr:hypothetical protein [Salinibacterium sp.]
MQRIVKYQALLRPLSRAEVSEFQSRMRDRPEFASTAFIIQVVVFAVIFVPITLGVVGFSIVAWIALTEEIAVGNPVGIAAILYPLIFLAVI